MPPSTAPAAASFAESAARAPRARWGFLEFFILAQVVLPAMMYLPHTQPLRVPIRIAPFALSIAGLWVLLRRGPDAPRNVRPHVATGFLLLIIAYLILWVFAPTTNSLLAGAAQVGLYFSVMAPVFWAPLLVRSEAQLKRVLAILLVCCGINAIVGVLQVYNPDRWMPVELSQVVLNNEAGVPMFIDAEGREIPRPPGLSDTPGAVCGPASTAALLGLVFALQPISWPRRIACGALAFAGLAAIYLSHVRTSILIVGGMYLVYALVLVLRGNRGRGLAAFVIAFVLFVAAFAFASRLGGESVVDRFATLFEDDPATVYNQSMRGYQLQYDTQQYLREFPFGAGLGRWGMMRLYFGNESNQRSPQIWAELQWPAWVLDGGIVLLVLYNLALLRTAWYEFRIAQRVRSRDLGTAATAIFAANAGVLALVFGFTPFTNQLGLQYWFLAGLLHGAASLPGAFGSGTERASA